MQHRNTRIATLILAALFLLTVLCAAEEWRTLEQRNCSVAGFVVGDVQKVLAGAVAARDYVQIEPKTIRFALGAGTLYQPAETGETLTFGGCAFVKSTDPQAGYCTEGYYSLLKSPFCFGVETPTSATATLFFDAGSSESAWQMNAFYDALLKRFPRAKAVGFIGIGEFERMSATALKRAPLDRKSLMAAENRDVYFHPVREEENVCAAIGGFLYKPGAKAPVSADQPSDAFSEALGRIFYINYAETQSIPLQQHVHVLLLRDRISPGSVHSESELLRAVSRKNVEDALHMLSQSLLRRAVIAVYSIDEMREFSRPVRVNLVDLRAVIPDAVFDIRYATTNNFTGKQVYPTARCLLRPEVAERLKRVEERLRQQGYRLKIYDAYRPLSVQQIFWRILPDDRYVADPAIGSRHNRGAAIDVTLVDAHGKDVPMPSEYDDFSERAHPDCRFATPEQKRNHEILRSAMRAEGFEQFPTEWWHFDGPAWRDCPISDY
jgi:D-alanyl-D-alanine dipeptidase